MMLNRHERYDWFAVAPHFGGDDGQQITTSKQEPWKPQQPYLKMGMKSAQQELLNQPQQYPVQSGDQAVADLNQVQQQALQAQVNRAQQGSPLTNAARQTVGSTAQGDYLYTNPGYSMFGQTASGQMLTPDTNPYLRGAYNAAADEMSRQYRENTVPEINSQAIRAGRTGSGAWADVRGQAQSNYANQLGDLANKMFSRQYEAERGRQMSAAQNIANMYQQERGRQMQAAQQAPQLAQLDYSNLQKMLQAGTIQQEQAQQEIDAEIKRQLYNQEEPYRRISRFTDIATGAGSGGTTTQRKPLYEDTGSQVLGGAATGAGLGYQMGGGWGAAAGAAAGGLLGAF